MQTVLGPFHPDLENALVDAISQHKQADLLRPLLILVPSDLIRRRLKILLAQERGLALLNVQLLTFHQLSLRLNGECGSAPTELHSDLFLDEATRQIIRTGKPGAQPFAGVEDRAGGCAALWQTLRDLRDGLVDPELALVALGEGHFTERTGVRTAQLLELLPTLQTFCDEQDIKDLRRISIAAPPNRRRRRLSTVQRNFLLWLLRSDADSIGLFRAVASHYPTRLSSLLTAIPGHDAWNFAARFYERYVQGRAAELAGESDSPHALSANARLFDGDKGRRSYARPDKQWQCKIVNTFGIEDEVATAAKEIGAADRRRQVGV